MATPPRAVEGAGCLPSAGAAAAHQVETVLDVPAKLAARVRAFYTGNARKTVKCAANMIPPPNCLVAIDSWSTCTRLFPLGGCTDGNQAAKVCDFEPIARASRERAAEIQSLWNDHITEIAQNTRAESLNACGKSSRI
jgi:hypothetical protein